jgi:hypothetical protein
MGFGGVITLDRLSMEPVCEPRSATCVSSVRLVPTHAGPGIPVTHIHRQQQSQEAGRTR